MNSFWVHITLYKKKYSKDEVATDSCFMKLLEQYKGLRKEIYILFFGKIVTSLGSMIWPVMTLILNQKMEISASGVAIVMILFGAVQLPLSLIGGKLADTYNKKNIIVIFDLMAIIFYFICGFIKLNWISIVLLFFASTLQSMEHPSYNALVADITLTKDRERAYSLLYLGNNIGMVASPTIAGLLFHNYLWLSFIISGLAIGTSTLMIALQVRDITPCEEIDKENFYQLSDESASAWSILKSNRVIFVYLTAMSLFWGAYNQYGYLMPLDLARVHGESGALIYGSVSSLNCMIVVIFTPMLTTLLVRVCYTKKLLLSIVLVVVGYTVFLLGLGHIPSYYLAIFLFTIGEIVATIMSDPYLMERMPASHRGRISSVMGMLQSFIVGAMMYLSGLIFDRQGSTAAWLFVLGVLGLSIVASSVLIPLDRKGYPELYRR